jgi:hypothetical protein
MNICYPTVLLTYKMSVCHKKLGELENQRTREFFSKLLHTSDEAYRDNNWMLNHSSIKEELWTTINDIVLQWLPESPRFDIARGMPDRAMATLERIARDNGKPVPLGKLVEVCGEVGY